MRTTQGFATRSTRSGGMRGEGRSIAVYSRVPGISRPYRVHKRASSHVIRVRQDFHPSSHYIHTHLRIHTHTSSKTDCFFSGARVFIGAPPRFLLYIINNKRRIYGRGWSAQVCISGGGRRRDADDQPVFFRRIRRRGDARRRRQVIAVL